MAAERRGRAALLARRPGAVAEALCVHVLHRHTRDRRALVVGQYGGDGRVHDEWYQEQEGEHGKDGGGAEAQRGVELGLLQEGLHRDPLLPLGSHDHRGLVGINDEAVYCLSLTNLANYSLVQCLCNATRSPPRLHR